ncbi:hypothetical protein LTR94_037817, partial [Friedmanniomyces endolithicus]
GGGHGRTDREAQAGRQCHLSRWRTGGRLYHAGPVPRPCRHAGRRRAGLWPLRCLYHRAAGPADPQHQRQCAAQTAQMAGR